ncbi:MAG TPA: helix-turn-helix domain-containing protein, partial [Kofleriaceae bacterium]|nr:helix-turn-helix domain-containing protein [Kofleriaceae bacterium]
MDDLPLITAHLLEKHAAKMKRPVSHFSRGAVEAMLGYDWPGNVRELENVIQRALALTSSAEIGAESLPPRVAQGAAAAQETADGGPRDAPGNAIERGQGGAIDGGPWSEEQTFRKAREIALGEFERRYFTRLLRRTEGNLSEAARLAGLDRSNLRRALARLGMRPEAWRGPTPR